MSPAEQEEPWLPPARTAVPRALAWWGAGILLAASALLLTEPSTTAYLAVARSGLDWPDLLADILIVGLSAWFAVVTWRSRHARPTRAATGLAAGVGALGAYLSSELVKLLLTESRPCRNVLPAPDCPGAGDWSFPSNHATVAFAVATAVVLVVGRWWSAGAYLPALVAASSRVVDGVHFPHDVIAGAVIGTCTTVACALLLSRRLVPLVARLSRRR
ncbi:phosphatase PAP2 family protein [Georgenia sp. 10Sc9-8]|uniref:Phosphatase PAP2 family protein n=1 Tax=Georgenia halotolerans TaxID=3028317 RepID=A0ABT5U1U1_9MICO|nr:phosphatase PAP2 family protein [Georgenia halotolerans]